MPDFSNLNFRPDPVINTAKDIEAFADRMFKEGRTRVSALFNKVPMVSSIKVFTQKDDALRDETHYFLVPFKLAEQGFALYSAHRLPEGYAATNDLEKVRIFHLHAQGGEHILENKLFANLVAEQAGPGESTLVQRLNMLGDEIDKHAENITGGMLLIGSTVAFVNPALGAGIALKALIPVVAGKLSKHGFKYGGDKISEWQEAKEQKAAEKKAQKQLKKARPELVINPLLATLDKALETSEAEFDPLLDFDLDGFDIEGYNRAEMLAMTAEAVFAVYEEVLGNRKQQQAAGLGPEDLRWLDTLKSWADHG